MVVSGCGKGGSKATGNGGAAGSAGASFDLLVFRPTDGVVTSTDGTINCGPAADQTSCAATYAWTDVVTLIATPKPGVMFSTWAGDCWTAAPCVLSTAPSGADKYVVAVFGPIGLAQHPNWTPPPRPEGGYPAGFTTVHGQEFLKWIDLSRVTTDNDPLAVGYFDCAACHGGSFDGMGIAPSCNKCHAANGSPNWQTQCDFCHGLPPPPTARPLSPSTNHPPVGGGAPACAGCHADTVNADGTTNNWTRSTPEKTHMNGKVDGGGHAPGFNVSSVHAPVFFDSIKANGSAAGCTQCHGANFDTVVPTLSAGAQSCTSCHETIGGVPNWLNQCDFCHGAPPPRFVNNTDPGATHPDTTAPCYACHSATVDANGVLITGGPHMNGQVEKTSPHSATPNFATAPVHGPQFLDAVAAAGTTNSCTTCHLDDYAGDMGGGKSCNSCHATNGWTSDGGLTSNWQTNCTFCHGTKTPNYASADLAQSAPPDDISMRLDGNLVPDRTGFHTQHVTGTGSVAVYASPMACASCHPAPLPTNYNHITPDRRAYPSLVTFDFASAFPSSGKTGSMGTYDGDVASPTYGTCTVYCHGATLQGGTGGAFLGQWFWYTGYPALTGCNDCHGQPPKTGRSYTSANIVANKYCGTTNGLPTGPAITTPCDNHTLHKNAMSKNGYDGCANCHFGSASNSNSALLHVNGKADVAFGYPPGKAFDAPTWDPGPKSCSGSTNAVTGCHFQTGGTAPTKLW